MQLFQGYRKVSRERTSSRVVLCVKGILIVTLGRKKAFLTLIEEQVFSLYQIGEMVLHLNYVENHINEESAQFQS